MTEALEFLEDGVKLDINSNVTSFHNVIQSRLTAHL